MKNFYILQKPLTKKEKGDNFEKVCFNILKFHPQFRHEKVWMYDDIPQNVRTKLKLPDVDRGIDILSKHEGKYYGVQCKYRQNPDSIISFTCLSTFCTQICHRALVGIIMTNADQVDQKEIAQFDRYKLFLGDFFDDLEKEYFNLSADEIKIIYKPKKLRKYQIKAIKVANKLFNENESCDHDTDDDRNSSSYDSGSDQNDSDSETKTEFTQSDSEDDVDPAIRGKLISACGTGKTCMIAEICKGYNKVLVLTPSLYLLSQTYKELQMLTEYKILLVGSDFDDPDNLNHVSINSTTDYNEIEEFIMCTDENYLVLCTYASARNILLGINWGYDLIVYDESHRLIGENTSNSRLIDGLTGKRKLFCTATERIIVGDGDDEEIDDGRFGETVLNYGLRQAINDGYLCPEEIICGITSTEKIEYCSTKDIPWLKFCKRLVEQCIEKYGINKLLTYHNTVENANKFAELLADAGYEAYVMDGSMSMRKRNKIIKDFAAEPKFSVICSAKCLNEGVNIPCVDSCIFVQAKKSTVDIIQSIGRTVRLFPGKERAYIIIPGAVAFDDINAVDELMTIPQYRNMISILRSIQNMDEDVKDFYIKNCNKPKKLQKFGNVMFDGELVFDEDMEEPDFYKADINAGIVTKLFRNDVNWYKKYERLVEYIEKYDKLPAIQNDIHDKRLGEWCAANRGMYKKNKLSGKRIYLLENLHIWYWSYNEVVWNENYELLQKYIEQYDKYPSDSDKINKSLGMWILQQRANFKKEKLSIQKINKLEVLPNWVWFYDINKIWHKTYNNVYDHIKLYKNYPSKSFDKYLWGWITKQKYEYKNNKLSDKKINLLEKLDNWEWEKNFEENWLSIYTSVKNYITKYGNYPSKESEKKLNIWIKNQRVDYKKNIISNSRIKLLEKLDNWYWVKNIDDIWMENYIELIDFIDEHKKYPNGNDKINKKLGLWVERQRVDYKNNELYNKRIKLLEKLNNWYWFKNLDEIWKQKYEELIIYINQYSKLPACCDKINKKLGKWVSHQRQNYKNGKMSDDRITMLEKLKYWKW